MEGTGREHHARESGRGLYVSEKELGGDGSFTIGRTNIYLFCTDEVKTFIEERRYTNVAFLEAGERVG